MDEIRSIIQKYERNSTEGIETLADINEFAVIFYRDVAEIYDCITRIRNMERNPTGFSLNDAPILGLLVKIWKVLKELARYYEEDSADFVSLLERPLLEAAITAHYLLIGDDDLIEDYRKCSYKDRLRILRDLDGGSPFLETKAGKRLLKSIHEKMALESLAPGDFRTQKANKWRIQGKNFYEIFGEIAHEDFYKCTYGMMSESIHGSWNESMDYCLRRNEDDTFSTNPFYCSADIRFICPLLRFVNEPYRLWLARIDATDPFLSNVLDWISVVNRKLFMLFDEKYDG